MSRTLAHDTVRAHRTGFSIVAALAIALFTAHASDNVAGAVANCAAGGNLADGGAAGIGCSFGGDRGVSVAGTIDVGDPALTIATGFGGYEGGPAINAAADIDISAQEVVLAGGVGGAFPCPAYNVAGSYP